MDGDFESTKLVAQLEDFELISDPCQHDSKVVPRRRRRAMLALSGLLALVVMTSLIQFARVPHHETTLPAATKQGRPPYARESGPAVEVPRRSDKKVASGSNETQPDIPTLTTATEYQARARQRFDSGDFELAIADAREASRLSPNKPEPYDAIGSSHLAIGEYESARKAYIEALRLDPNYVAACNNLAWLYATCPNPQYRDGRQAVALATRAVEASNGVVVITTALT